MAVTQRALAAAGDLRRCLDRLIDLLQRAVASRAVMIDLYQLTARRAQILKRVANMIAVGIVGTGYTFNLRERELEAAGVRSQ